MPPSLGISCFVAGGVDQDEMKTDGLEGTGFAFQVNLALLCFSHHLENNFR